MRDMLWVICVVGSGMQVWAVKEAKGKERKSWGHLVGFLCAKLNIGGVHVAVTYSTHFH